VFWKTSVSSARRRSCGRSANRCRGRSRGSRRLLGPNASMSRNWRVEVPGVATTARWLRGQRPRGQLPPVPLAQTDVGAHRRDPAQARGRSSRRVVPREGERRRQVVGFLGLGGGFASRRFQISTAPSGGTSRSTTATSPPDSTTVDVTCGSQSRPSSRQDAQSPDPGWRDVFELQSPLAMSGGVDGNAGF
jgi:hypothetical protein